MKQSYAVFSKCTKYRYLLNRTWKSHLPICLFLGLNPSTASADEDDPTIRRLTAYAEGWGLGGFSICNLFAYRSTDFKKLKSVTDPVGSLNDHYIRHNLSLHDEIILMWGNQGAYLDRPNEVLPWIKNPKCFKQNKSGMPQHPLYLSKKICLIPFNPKLLEC